MGFRLTAVALVATLVSAFALTPMSPAAAAQRGGQGLTGDAKGKLADGGNFEGRIEITEIKLASDKKNLLVSGELRGKENGRGRNIKQEFKNVPASLRHSAGGASDVLDEATEGSYLRIADLGLDEGLTLQQQQAVCDILFLFLGPIFLDLLGLEVTLLPVVLDVNARPGPGNLLGNLLCALAGLLDPQ